MAKYVRVAGGLTDLSSDQRHHIIGYRQHANGFDGMAETTQAAAFGPGVLTEDITLDDIIIYMNKGIHHE